MHTNTSGVVQINNVGVEPPPPWLALNGAFALIFSKGRHGISRILTVRRKDNGKTELPGGGLEEDETSINALRREVGEETRLNPPGEFLLAGQFRQKVPLRDPSGKILRNESGKSVQLFTGSVDLWLYTRIVDGERMLRDSSACPVEVESVNFTDTSAIAQLGTHHLIMLGHLRMIAAFMAKSEGLIGKGFDWAERCCVSPIQGALSDPVTWGERTY